MADSIPEKLTDAQIIANHHRDIEQRQADALGITPAEVRLLHLKRKEDAQALAPKYLEKSLEYKAKGEKLQSIADKVIKSGRTQTKKDQRMLRSIFKSVKKMQEWDTAYFRSYENARDGYDLPVGYQRLEVIDD